MDLHHGYGIKIHDKCKCAIYLWKCLLFLPAMLKISVFDFYLSSYHASPASTTVLITKLSV